jgi:2-methylcitrate dehydratase
MTGPPQPFEGASGIWEQVTGPFELQLPVRSDEYVVEDVHTKTRPAEYNAQAPIDLVLDARPAVAIDEIEAVELETYHLAYHEIGMDAAKWDPRTRETADHSLPYLLAVALVDGHIDEQSCAPERVLDPALRPLMQRISIRERPEFTERFPAELRARLVIRMADGTDVVRETSYPKGHRSNPLTDAELDDKFERMVGDRSAADGERCARLRAELWAFGDVKDVGDVMRPLGALSVAGAAVGEEAGDGR